MDCVRLLERVFLPFAGWPHGLTGWRLPRVRPPSGWSTGFMVSPRTVGRAPRPAGAPALPAPRRADAAPAVGAGLADHAQVVLLVADLADRRPAIHVHAADLARAHAK